MSRTSLSRRSRPALALLAVAAVLSSVLATFATGPEAVLADTAGNQVVTRASTPYQTDIAPNGPLTGLKSGDVINIAVSAPGAGNLIYGMEARLCRAGININFSSQFSVTSGNCIGAPIAPETSSYVTRAYDPPNTSGTLPFKVGTGTEASHEGAGAPITCDHNNPCALWLRQAVPTSIILSGNAFVHYDLHFAAPAGAPAAPTGVTATAGDTQATVSWTASTTTDPAISGYTVTSTPGSKTCTTTGATSCTVTGLTNGTAYTFAVTATNTSGTSAPSASSSAVTPQSSATAPGQPTAVTATAGNAQAAVSWSAPASNGGSTITGYTATSTPGSKTCTTTGATTCTVTGLTNGTAYTFTVTATNAVGTGAASAASTAVTPTAPPLTFSDVPPGAPFYEDIMWLAGEGITTGANGKFNPLGATTRGSVAAFLYRYADSPNGPNPTCTSAPFNDVPANHPFCGYIEWMVDSGYASGYAGNLYKPENPMTRGAMAAFLYRYADSPDGPNPTCASAPFNDVPASNTFCGYITWLSTSGITAGVGNGNFNPGGIVSRQTMARYLHIMHELEL